MFRSMGQIMKDVLTSWNKTGSRDSYHHNEKREMLELLNLSYRKQAEYCDPICYEIVMNGDIEELKRAGGLSTAGFEHFNLCSIGNMARIILSCKDPIIVEHNKKILAELKIWLETQLS
ncbi:MAG: hypothetical protein ACYCQJ_13870 [Nitrososphaerales archaeon]